MKLFATILLLLTLSFPVFAQSPCDDVTSITYQGYEYDIVEIGEQCWFAENCRYLPSVGPSNEGSETEPYYYVYDYQGTDVESAMSTDNYGTYGVLYNWPAVISEDICPSGWSIPSSDEWNQLRNGLGETTAGIQMKSVVGWDSWPDNLETNTSGFSGLPGGYRLSDGFMGVGTSGFWWSSASGYDPFICASDNPHWFNLSYASDVLAAGCSGFSHGRSARCVTNQLIVSAPGCTDMQACNYNEGANFDDGSCAFAGDGCDDGDEFTENDVYSDDCECSGTEVEIVPGCVYETACNFNPEANQDDMSCSFPGDSCDDNDVSTGNDTYTDDCECVGEPLAGGCTYESACNFNPDAQFDDNSCVFVGDSCDDGDSETEDDVINADCDCAGNPVTSVSQLDVESLSVYPNPVSDQLTVELGSLQGTSVLVKIFDSQGKLVFDENRTGTFIIDVSTYNTGVYSISVESESEVIKAQFIVE